MYLSQFQYFKFLVLTPNLLVHESRIKITNIKTDSEFKGKAKIKSEFGLKIDTFQSSGATLIKNESNPYY